MKLGSDAQGLTVQPEEGLIARGRQHAPAFLNAPLAQQARRVQEDAADRVHDVDRARHTLQPALAQVSAQAGKPVAL